MEIEDDLNYNMNEALNIKQIAHYDIDDNESYDIEAYIPAAVKRCVVHVIQKGDTLYGLARKYDVQIFDIMRLNPYLNVYNLQIGDEVCIPAMNDVSDRQI